jgi:hypothetical protein
MVSVPQLMLLTYQRERSTGGASYFAPVVLRRLFQEAKPLVRRSRHWHPDVIKEIRRLRTELPNLGKEQIFVRLKPWCERGILPVPARQPLEGSLPVLTIKCG